MTWALVPIRLADVPLSVRERAARRLMDKDPGRAADYVLAALCPSETTYMVDEDEARRVGVPSVPGDSLTAEPRKRGLRHRVDPANRPLMSA